YLPPRRRARLRAKIAHVRALTSNERLQLFPDFQQRLGVLRAAGYVDGAGDTVQLKGRVACEVNTADELVVTEMVFENVLQHLDPPEIAGILSALVFQERSDNQPPLTPRLQAARASVEGIARGLGALQAAHGLPTSPDDFAAQNLNFGLVDVVYDWARGVPFAEICQITLVQEGTIVRTVTRLDELLREVRNAARVVGDPTLYRKMEATSQLIRRGVIFCASLYL
ncbi:DEAD/DEAH box RNA helicase, partial [Tribonema minus]